MHNKFLLIETPRCQIVTFSSLNFSVRSIHANHELLMVSENLFLYHAFQWRWDEMRLEVQSQKQKGQR
jgi:phosphatidylserine/phosphatidylglycerophosphate/cardiolipin synthase-like enzyme